MGRLTEKELKVIATAFHTTKPGMFPNGKTLGKKLIPLVAVWLLIIYIGLFVLSQM